MAMFECADCGCNESVCLRTYPGPHETVRSRRCMKCGSTFKTAETMVPNNTTHKPTKNPGKKPKAKKRSVKKEHTEVPKSALEAALKSAK